MSKVLEIKTLAEFENCLKESSKVLVDFYATWCGPCRMIAPKIEEFAAEYTHIKFIKVDVDAASEVAEKYKITSMPTFQLYVDGEKKAEVLGATESKVKTMLDNA